MGKSNRADKRRKERTITLTAGEMQRIATEQAQIHFDSMKEELTKNITNSVNLSWCYLIAKSLEDSFKWFETEDKKDPEKVHIGINRIYKVLGNFICSVDDMDKGLISVQDIGNYFKDKGLVLKFDNAKDEVTHESTNSN